VLRELLVNTDSLNPESGLGFLGVFSLEAEDDLFLGGVDLQEIGWDANPEVVVPGGTTALEMVT